MGYKYIAEIPLSKIDHIELYINKGKKSISRIKSETGCQYILNGSLFNMKTFKQYCNVKSKGVVQSNPHYNEYGMAWNTNDIVMTLIPDKAANYKNYIGMKALRVGGVDKPVNDNESGIGGKRGRSAIALKGKDTLVLYCSKDRSSYASYPSGLRNELKKIGCTDILMLDGGGSSQCNFNGNVVSSSSRIVANAILVYLKKTGTTGSSSSTTTKPSTSTGTKIIEPAKKMSVNAVTTANVNIRTGPGTSYDRIGLCLKGTKIVVTGKNTSGTWYRYNKGWLCATYVKLSK